MTDHVHEWARGPHIAKKFGVSGRAYHCSICGLPMVNDVPTTEFGELLVSETQRLNILIRFKLALSTPPTEVEVEWPHGWPLPVPGDAVAAGSNRGVVTHFDFEPENGRIVINTR